MPFKKGHAKIGGRQKGSTNKKRLKKVADVLAELEINPINEILDIIQNEDMTPTARVDAWMQILAYCQAKPKDDEADKDDGWLDDLDEVSEATILKLINSENP